MRRTAAALALLLACLPAAAQWQRLATEGQPFTVPADTQVRYGAGTTWVTTTASGAGTCSNAFFGRDPIVGTLKTCEVRVTCAPKEAGGTGSDALFEVNATGAAVGWWCPSATTPTLYGATWAWLATHPAAVQALFSIKGSADPAAQLTQLATANVQQGTPPGSFPTLAARLAMGAPPPAPAASVPAGEAWVVAKAASNANPPGTRPAFILLPDGTLVDLYATERVKQGDACDCTRASLQRGSVRYCQTGTRSDKVAVCVRR